MRFTPRDYQKDGLDALRYHYDNGYTRLLAHMATGLGKTSGIAANVPLWFPELTEVQGGEGGILFIAHRIEIVRQAMDKFQKIFPHLWIGLEQAANEATGYEDIIFASVDSLGRLMSDRIMKYRDRKFGAVIVDEAHHCAEDNTWDNILSYFGVGSDPDTHYELSSGRKPLAVHLTATPVRSDGQSLAPFLDRCPTSSGAAFSYDILYGVRNGWLTDITAYKAAPKRGDLAALELDEQVDYIIKTYKDYAEGLQTLAFARSVEQSQLLANTLNEYGICEAGHIDANTEKEDRERILEAYAAGGISFLTNRLVFTEGWDAPGIQCVLDNAPTSSQGLFLQKLGRGLRPSPDARVDAYKTPEERREAIKRSSKPSLIYISTFDPTMHGLTIAGSVWGDRDIDSDGKRIVEEVIDVIELAEEEHPERPIRDVASIDQLEIELSRVDVWTQTIENPKLHAVTPLRWVIDGDGTKHNASLYLNNNPRAKNDYERTPVIYRFQQEGDGWRFYEIVVGGWVEKLGHAVKAQVRKGKVTRNIGKAIRQMDSVLHSRYESLYHDLKRGANGPATAQQIKYLKGKGISVGASCTEETAAILIDDYRIKDKLKKVEL